MKIEIIKVSLWIKPSKKELTDKDSEELVIEIRKLIENKGYVIPLEFGGNNPELTVFKS